MNSNYIVIILKHYTLSVLLNVVVSTCEATAVQPYKDKANLTTLRMVHIIFRHGERNPMPMSTYYNGHDPYNNLSYWPEGFANLTQNGKFQSYDLGMSIRERYSKFISRTYNRNEVKVQSSELFRTLLSAQAALAGMYGQPRENRDNWQKYKFTILKASEDKTIRGSKICPRNGQMYKDFFLRSDVMLKFNADFTDLFTTINENTGLNITYLSKDLCYFADSIIIKKERNLTLPSWIEKIYDSEQLQFILTFRFIALTYTREMKRFRAGPLLKEILENMRNGAASSTDQINSTKRMEPAKMFLYSGHETTVADMLISFGVFDKIRDPPYASAIFLELHQLPKTNKFFVELFFKNNFTTETTKMEIQNCEYFCDIDRLATILKHIIPDNWEQECSLDDNYSRNSFGINSKALPIGYPSFLTLFPLIISLMFTKL